MTTPGTSTAALSAMNDMKKLAQRVITGIEWAIEDWDGEQPREAGNKTALLVNVMTSAKRLLGKLEAEEEDADRRRQEAETKIAELTSKAEEIREQLQAERVEYRRKVDEYSTDVARFADSFQKLQVVDGTSAREIERLNTELEEEKSTTVRLQEDLDRAIERESTALARVRELQGENERLKREAQESNALHPRKRPRPDAQGGDGTDNREPGGDDTWDANIRSLGQWLLTHKPIPEAGSPLTPDEAVAEMMKVIIYARRRRTIDRSISHLMRGEWYCFQELAERGYMNPNSEIESDGTCRTHDKCLQVRRGDSLDGLVCLVVRMGG
ncbi:uncharacterized protein F4807DRAFT_437154 [Annulohypoxylon truncatum]|uniref:uncharacterized protein n=1 Tax=Annulohypoxylon truncatum TaxID=327061 RepID=UPI002008C0D7|nr:uncharacterized protein F4807DRAFT_437154 [Annulohypoxylon truncatum]KAI1206776.1 hypothetical protein F4807DRAFT_437154 [Annulohypoxylon truncatum]